MFSSVHRHLWKDVQETGNKLLLGGEMDGWGLGWEEENSSYTFRCLLTFEPCECIIWLKYEHQKIVFLRLF